MRYENIKDLPTILKEHLPEGAQEIYLETYQWSWDNYEDENNEMSQESVAHRDGMHAVYQDYAQVGKSGKWVRRDELDMVEVEEEEPGFFDSILGSSEEDQADLTGTKPNL
jgi:cation transport regulator ChaB